MSLPVPAPKPCAPGRFRAGLRLFEPAPSIPVTLSDPAAIAKKYKLWQVRVLFFSILGYATFYLVRKNLGIAMPFMGKELGITKEGLGLFLTPNSLSGTRRTTSAVSALRCWAGSWLRLTGGFAFSFPRYSPS